MKILADTNVLLWFLSDDEQLEWEHKEAMENPKKQGLRQHRFSVGNRDKTEYRQA